MKLPVNPTKPPLDHHFLGDLYPWYLHILHLHISPVYLGAHPCNIGALDEGDVTSMVE